jgi:carbon-monoxide dehydrogenase small subunit
VLSSNLCRCTGYQNIITAVRAAAAEMRRGVLQQAGAPA